MNDVQYYRQVLENICSDYQRETVQGTAAVWITAILCFAILYFSYRFAKQKHLTYQSKRVNSTSRKKQKKAEAESAVFGRTKDKYQIVCVILAAFFVTLQIVLCVGYHQRVTDIKRDIAEEAFEIYNGTFSVRSVKGAFWGEHSAELLLSDNIVGGSSDCLLYDLYNQKAIYPDYSQITHGVYRGKVVYGKNSGFVVDWSIE